MPSCPICGRQGAPGAESTRAPFCSARCKQIDLGKWLDAKYRVAVPDEQTDQEEVEKET